MSFSIEVPGASTPLSEVELCRTLQSASSYDNSKRQAAGQQLSSWESHSDYYPALQAVFLDRNLPREIRLLAIITLKNGIDKYWRHHTVKNAIPPDAKLQIRSKLLRGTVEETDEQLALYNALVLAKVVRFAFPDEWPDALANLMDMLRAYQDANQHHLRGALLMLLRIVKELGTARLRKSQTALHSNTPEMAYILGQIYSAQSTTWISYMTSQNSTGDAAALAMKNSLLAFRVLQRLLLVGYDDPHTDETVQQVWVLTQTQFGQLLKFVGHGSALPETCNEGVGKHLIQFAKLHIGMAETHAASFAFLPNSLDLARAYWDLVARFAETFVKSEGIRHGATTSEVKSKVEGPLSERLALKGLLLARACMKMVHRPKQTIRYRSKEVVEGQRQAIAQLGTNLFNDEFVVQMANVIITHLFVFRQADLQAWEEDPQEWEQQEEAQGNAYEWEVRPCAEKLFLDLLTHYKRLLIQPLLSYFATAENPQADVVAKEAVYTAMGLAAPIVEQDFSFDKILVSTIASDAQRTGPMCQILRRRVAILLSQWAPISLAEENRPIVYEIFRHFLNPADPSNDIVVRITAARQFKAVVDDIRFDGEVFRPFAADYLMQLVNLLSVAEIDEAKLAILETMRSLIQRLDRIMSQFSDFVMSALPGIWESNRDLGFMMKQAVLAIMQTLVGAMKTQSRRYHPQMLPLIAEAADTGSELYIYLGEETLDLWTNILTQAEPPLSPELLGLADLAIKLLADQNEHAPSCLNIVGLYITLAPQTVFEDRLRRPLLGALSASFDSRSREQVRKTTKYVDAIIRSSEELGGMQGFQTILQDMVQEGLFGKMLEGIHDAFEADQTSGPKRRQAKVSSTTLSDYFVILSRISLANPTAFVEVLASMGPLDVVWGWLSAEWFSNFDRLGEVHQQKLNLLGLTRLLELPQPMQELVLRKLQDFFSMWTSVMVQLLDPDEPGNDQLVGSVPIETSEWDTPTDVIERDRAATDPVKTIQSLPFVKERLHDLVRRAGGEQAFQENWAVNIDKEVIVGFQSLGTPREHAL
ncbi:putative importin 11 [Xylariaceae sp. FL0804]|nr:putative importin 11 [Xylariaceae sp. FL0804]